MKSILSEPIFIALFVMITITCLAILTTYPSSALREPASKTAEPQKFDFLDRPDVADKLEMYFNTRK